MHHTSRLMFDRAVAQAWLRQPSDTHTELTRAAALSVDEELTGRGAESFPSTIRCVPAPVRDAAPADDAFGLLLDGK